MTGERWTGVVDDVGRVSLPWEAGHLAVAVFERGSDRWPRWIPAR